MISGHLISYFFQLAKTEAVDESKCWCLSSSRSFGTPLLANSGFQDESLLVDAYWLNHISLEARALEVLACHHHRCGGWKWWPKSTWKSGQSATEEVGNGRVDGWLGLDDWLRLGCQALNVVCEISSAGAPGPVILSPNIQTSFAGCHRSRCAFRGRLLQRVCQFCIILLWSKVQLVTKSPKYKRMVFSPAV